MPSQEHARIQCPHCGEPLEILVDPSSADQEYVEDCEVCCQPMAIRAVFDAEQQLWVTATPEND